MKSSNHWKNLPKEHPRRRRMRYVQMIRSQFGFQIGGLHPRQIEYKSIWKVAK